VFTDSLSLASVLPPTTLSVIAVLALVFCDFREIRAGRFIFKPLAAAAFVWLAVSLDATSTAYGNWLLAALIFCMVGDLLLMPDSERSFLAGLMAFLAGHLLFAVAFLQLPANPVGLLLSGLPALGLLVVVWRWLIPHVNSEMKFPVMLYIHDAAMRRTHRRSAGRVVHHRGCLGLCLLRSCGRAAPVYTTCLQTEWRVGDATVFPIPDGVGLLGGPGVT
jgi:YhhN family